MQYEGSEHHLSAVLFRLNVTDCRKVGIFSDDLRTSLPLHVPDECSVLQAKNIFISYADDNITEVFVVA